MEYGCIGEVLKHSFSREIHGALADYAYTLREIPRGELDAFMTARDFRAINVTIPYKEAVIPYLHTIDEHARAIGAVNTVVNRGGQLYGYNTDFYGMAALLRHANIDAAGRKVAVIGTGGTSKTACAVAQSLSAGEVITVSRSGRGGAVTYEEFYAHHSDTELIIHTTPVGMYPHIFDQAVDIAAFPHLCGVIDAVYNPLRTPLIAAAQSRGIPAEGGLYMLVAQAVRAAEIFLDTTFDETVPDSVFHRMRRRKENIVLMGMPASGKSTVGARLAELLRRPFVDTDDEIAAAAGMTIPDIFAQRGEAAFRELEREAVRRVSATTGAVIATGGGAVLDEGNIRALRQNGRIYWLDRPLAHLLPTADRPLSATKEAVAQRYHERHHLYAAAADVPIDGADTVEQVAQNILREFER